MNSILNDLHEKIMESDEIVLVLVVAEGCYENTSTMQTDIENILGENSMELKLFTMCLDENNMVWPRPLTQTLYYFAPKNTVPLFHKVGRASVTNLLSDIETAKKIIDGSTFVEASFDTEQQKLIEKTENILTEEQHNPTYPPKIQMVRNFGKEMWKSAIRAGKNLPVLVSGDVAQTRFTICEGCEHFTKEARCTQCGCFMKAKVNLETSTCPIGKW